MYRSNNNNDSDDDDIISNPMLTQPELLLDNNNDNNNNYITPPPPSNPNLAYGSANLNQLKAEHPSKDDKTNNDLDAIVISIVDSLLLSIGETLPSCTEDILNSLTEEQQNAVNMILSDRKKNVFLKGNPGTGKSFLLSKLKKLLQNQKKKFQYLAPTGSAAENIGGTTIHSFFKFVNDYYNFIDNPKQYKHEIERPDIIVIDEISQVSGEFLDLIDNKAKFLWNNDESMGGCQVIICGDFFQLPPIPPINKKENKKRDCPRKKVDEGYAFQSKVWSRLNLQTVELTVPKRQSDPQFYNILNQVRIGKIKQEHIGYLHNMATVKSCNKLFSTNKEVNSYNTEEYNKKKGAERKYYTSTIKDQTISISNKENIKLRVDTEVMLTANLKLHREPYLINGSRGKVCGFVPYDKVIDQLLQDKKNIEENESYDVGTRNKLIDSIICLIEVIRKNAENGREQKTLEYPIVDFKDTKVTVLPFRTYENESNLRYESGSHYQELAVPLAYSYALTIHKSQGLSFDSLTVDLSDLPGYSNHAAAYVALSRCKDPHNLTIEKIEKLRTLSPPNINVIDFYRTGNAIVWNENVDDLFILCDDKDFVCPECGKKSKACFDAENPSVASFLRDSLVELPDEESMNKIVLALSKQGFSRINQVKRSPKGLGEDVLRSLFRSEEIPIRVAEDAIVAIQNLFKDDQQSTRSRR